MVYPHIGNTQVVLNLVLFIFFFNIILNKKETAMLPLLYNQKH